MGGPLQIVQGTGILWRGDHRPGGRPGALAARTTRTALPGGYPATGRCSPPGAVAHPLDHPLGREGEQLPVVLVEVCKIWSDGKEIRPAVTRQLTENGCDFLVKLPLQLIQELPTCEVGDRKMIPGLEDIAVATDQMGARADSDRIHETVVAGIVRYP